MMIQVVRESRNYLMPSVYSRIHTYIHDGTRLSQWKTSASDIRSLVKFHLLLDIYPLHHTWRIRHQRVAALESMKLSPLKVGILRSCFLHLIPRWSFHGNCTTNGGLISLTIAFIVISLNPHIFIS